MSLNPSPPKNAVLVAIDVAKRRNEVLIAFPGVNRRKRLSVLNSREEHDRLIAYLADLGAPVAAAFEATGNYHRPIAWRLIEAGVEVRLISSIALARTREALYNGWDSPQGPLPQWGRVSPQDGSEGRPGHAAHDADRRDASVSGSDRRWDQRHPGALEDP